MPNYKYAPKYHYGSLLLPQDGVKYIYALHLHGRGNFVYVGSTKNPRNRLTNHHQSKGQGNKRLYDWIHAHEGQVRMAILETVTADARGAERRWCKKLSRKGHRLFNIRAPRKLTKKEREALVMEYLHGD